MTPFTHLKFLYNSEFKNVMGDVIYGYVNGRKEKSFKG